MRTLTRIDGDFDADKGEFSAAEREKDAEEGVAMPDGSYPIRSAKDVENALQRLLPHRQESRTSRRTSSRAPRRSARKARCPTTGRKRPTRPPASPMRGGPHAPGALAKAAAALTHAALKLDRARPRTRACARRSTSSTPTLADMKKRIAALEAQPLPAKAALRSIAKTADGADEALVSADDAVKRLASLPAHERALALTKLSLANPAPPRF